MQDNTEISPAVRTRRWVFFLLIALIFAGEAYYFYLKDGTPLKGRVVDKRSCEERRSGQLPTTMYYVTIETADGKRVTLSVRWAVYAKSEPGMTLERKSFTVIEVSGQPDVPKSEYRHLPPYSPHSN